MGRTSEAYRLMLAPKISQPFEDKYFYFTPDAPRYKQLRRLWAKQRVALRNASWQCKKKGSYATWDVAQESLKRLKVKHPNLKHAYWCLPCECYHLTSMTVAQMKKIKGF